MSQIKSLLDYWYNLEFFSPLTINKQKQMSVISDKEMRLPWHEVDKRAKGYEVFLGTYTTGDLVEEMYKAIDKKDAIDEDKSISYLCGLQLDEDGKYVEESFSVSPYIWAVAQIIYHRNVHIDLKEEVLEDVNEKINDYLVNQPSFNHEALKKLCEKIQSNIQLSIPFQYRGLIDPLKKSPMDEEKQTNSVLPSFYASDIKMVRKEIDENDPIAFYIKALIKETERIHIDSDVEHMKKWTHPDRYPLGKWPSIYHPSLMQQIAINMGISDEGFTNNIFSVNGPPGTGKTTLLKEIIASNVVERAIKLSQLNQPSHAFTRQSFISPPGQFLKNFYMLRDDLKEYGIIVASNNNNAVENLSKELPLADEVANAHSDLFNIRKHKNVYFTELAKHLEEDEPFWGIISLAGGKSSNIKKMKTIFDNRKGKRFGSLYEGEIHSWKEAKQSFKKKHDEVLAYRKKLKEIYENVQKLDAWKEDLNELQRLMNEINSTIIGKTEKLESIKMAIKNLEERIIIDTHTINELKDRIPFYKKWFSFFFKNDISFQKIKELEQTVNHAIIEKNNNQKDEVETNQQLHNAETSIQKAKKEYTQLEIEIQTVEEHLDNAKEKLQGNFADDAFWKDITNNESSQLASPWTNKDYDLLREELFYEALQLHESFILNSKEVKQNINCLMNMWDGAFQKEDKQLAYAYLLNTLMMISPVISTTFASVKRFLADVGKGELGMLVIDEAGQATPHQALGAIWRTSKAIVVGDPLQVEPVVTVPKTITTILADNLSIDAAYRPLELSVQVLADHVNRFGGMTEYLDKELWLGCPLSVHRRCLDPMFSISNEIAYNNRMYNQSVGPKDNVKLLFKQSQWLDINGKSKGGKNHFIQEQGDKVVECVLAAYDLQGEFPNLYIISPFKSVAEGIKTLLRRQLKQRLVNEDPKQIISWVRDSCGTIHTFQGKEAHEVILVLGCDNNEGKGAANWAGSTPNILNVAVTRAKYRLVIIGDSKVWKDIPYFEDAFKTLKRIN
ncbi:AAA domain-containing protein [Bacillus sp. FJAT-50079]|uniref:AAA domain-containing protein n=1 Tax=Bacillus sp. FJAT-50079 TaxID=2833577 RepID=UPI001BC8EA5F|nr:AAA domain-containing protein [Bacillus sp. FJAT-50079]MBS4209547.1 ATP-binding protein [Bacillus sp. FJAT-50079]